MAVLLMPVENSPSVFTVRVVLDEVPFRIDFRFNSRESFWYFDLKDDAGVQLRSGIKVTSGFPLLWRMQSSPRPNGELVVLPRGSQDLEASRNDFGGEVPMYYFEIETLISALGL